MSIWLTKGLERVKRWNGQGLQAYQMRGGGAEAGKGYDGVDLEDISVEVHCAEYDHRQRGGLRETLHHWL